MADPVLPVPVLQTPQATLPRRVSYTQLSLFQQCPLKFYFTYVAGWKEPPTAALTGGSITHDVVERLYRLPPEERTIEQARSILREHGPRMLRRPEYKPFENDNAMKQAVLEAVENLFQVEDPTTVVVDPDHLEMELDVEINGVPFFGRVDRFTVDGANRVTDYKTGKGPGRFIDDKLRQPYLYALAFKTSFDIDVHQVELIFLSAREVVRRDTDQGQVTAMGEALAVMHAESQRDLAESTWQARQQRLCDFCTFARACPVRNVDAPTPGSAASDLLLIEAGLAQR